MHIAYFTDNLPLQITPALLCDGQESRVEMVSGIPKISRQSKRDSSNPVQSTLLNITVDCCDVEELFL